MPTIGQYQIEIYPDKTFDEESTGNKHHYDFVYFEKSKYVFPTMLGITVFENNTLLTSAIIGSIGGGAGIHQNTVVYEDTKVTVCCSDTIFCLSVPDLALIWRTKADQASCFEIFKYQDNYIIHGELEITRLDKNGKILWQQSGADIFVTSDGSQNFKLTDDYIIVKDFENREYKFGYDGMNLSNWA